MRTWPSRLFRICLINSQDLPNQHLQGESTTLVVVVAKDTVTVVSFHGHKVIACHHTMEDIVFKVFKSKNIFPEISTVHKFYRVATK